MAAKPAPSDLFEALRRAREATGESVEALAARAGVDSTWLAGVEGGAAPDDDGKVGLVGNALNIDLSKMSQTRRRRPASRAKASAPSSSMDAAVRKAVRAELEPIEAKVRTLSDEVAALEKALREVASVAASAAQGSKASKASIASAAKAPAKPKATAKASAAKAPAKSAAKAKAPAKAKAAKAKARR